MEKPQLWEYQVFTMGSVLKSTKDEDIQEFLNHWGAEGWEVIAVHILENTNKIRLYAKRPLSGSPPRTRKWPV
ncbi:MAG: DUF4177 domain-containing protein [Anaerolineales bacterium]|jgi:hypothetical protein|nr:DUF4177 domain-containing protein [Anaerolineales bacterium]